jgi:ferric-dicitrate binding protein FerR (iron transport regulator)
MEPNNQIEELIARYLINDLSEEEDSLVIDWINASEENRRYFIQIRDTWQLTAVKLTAQVDEAAEWDLFRGTIAARDENSLREEEGRENRSVIYRRLLRVAVAAAVVLLVGLGWMYFIKGDQQQAVVMKPQQKVGPAIPVLQREVNTTGKEKRITLADGSIVVLFNNSEIVCEKQFSRRHIKLVGKAFFKVAKDAGRPFTVESDAILTTALGTEFTVTAFANAKQLTVRLYEGKVVIEPTGQNNRIMKQAAYLAPGQEFIYGPNTTTVRSFETESKSSDVKQEEAETTTNDDPSLPVNTKGSWHMYNNQALSQVLDHLAATYEVSIVYDVKEVRQKYFVGQFRTTDSIEVILKLITKATSLKYTREGNTYIIHQ